MQYIIYKLQNRINGKVYIGKTKRTLPVRMKDHLNSSCCTYLHNAIKKYGSNAFSSEIIYITDNEDDVCNKEREFILQYNSLSPNGYNLVIDTNQGRTFHKDTLELMSRNIQGISRSDKIWSRFIGVRSRHDINCFSTRVTKSGKSYSHYYSTELEAAEAYDKVVLYLYGFTARLNFPEKMEDYRKVDLKKFYNEFRKRHKKTSKHIGISYVPYIKHNKWRAIVYKNGKQINLGCFETEAIAYEAKKSYIEKNGVALQY